MKKLTAREFVDNQLPLNVTSGGGYEIETGDFAVSTIRKAVNYFGYRCEIDKHDQRTVLAVANW